MKQFVNELVSKYKTRDPFELAYRLGILIIVEPLGKIESYLSSTAIHVNSSLPEWAQKFTAACQIYNVLHPPNNLGFIFKNCLDYSKDSLRFAVYLATDFERLEKEGFEKLSKDVGIKDEELLKLKTIYYKIIGDDRLGEA